MRGIFKQSQSQRYIEDQIRMRRRRLAGVFQTTNQILTGDNKLRVSIVENLQHPTVGRVPGMSQYPNIILCDTAFGDLTKAETVVALLGLNYHELCHIMFSPRDYISQLNTADVMAYRILEDQRIESIFTALYEPAGKYFTQTFIKAVVDDPRAWGSAFLWSYGRSYLPLEIRQEFESRFARQDLMNRAKKHIDEYKKYTSSDFWDHASKIEVKRTIHNFARVLQEVRNSTPTPKDQDCGGADQQEGNTSPEEEEATDQENKRRRREKRTGEDQSNFWDEDEDEDEDGEDEDGQGNPSGEDSEDDDDDDDSGTGDGSEDSDDDYGDSDSADDEEEAGEGDSESDEEGGEEDASASGADGDDDSDGDEEGEPGAGESDDFDGDSDDLDSEDSDSNEHGSGENGEGSAFSNQELEDYLEEIVNAVNEDDAVNNEIGRIQTAMNDHGNLDVIDFDYDQSQDASVSASMTMEANKISDELRRLYADVEPGWKYGSDEGKLNVGRAMSGDHDFDEIFDEWDEGREQEIGLETVIALDVSGSMHGSEIVSASQALWCIKRGLDDTESHVTVLGFGDQTVGLYERNEKVDWANYKQWFAPGADTQPAQSFHLARRILENTDMPNKLFVILTDGGWNAMNDDEGGRYEDLEELIDSIPGTRIYIEINDARWGSSNEDAQEHFDICYSMKNPEGLAEVVRQAVQRLLSRR